MSEHAGRGKRGRPPKFGRPGKVVAITLPEEVVVGLQKIHADLAWAIVTLFEKTAKGRPKLSRPPVSEAELTAVGGPRSLIVVPRQLFEDLDLPGVNILPLHDDRAFLALQPGRGMSDLVLAVDDRLAERSLGRRETAALRRLRTQLREWRRDPHLRCDTRAIIVIERSRARRSA
jgi:hypothetical protein